MIRHFRIVVTTPLGVIKGEWGKPIDMNSEDGKEEILKLKSYLNRIHINDYLSLTSDYEFEKTFEYYVPGDLLKQSYVTLESYQLDV